MFINLAVAMAISSLLAGQNAPGLDCETDPFSLKMPNGYFR